MSDYLGVVTKEQENLGEPQSLRLFLPHKPPKLFLVLVESAVTLRKSIVCQQQQSAKDADRKIS